MNQKEFDEAIRSNLQQETGYPKPGSGKYENYYTKDDFDKFVSEMEKNHNKHYLAYTKGNGKELKEKVFKNGRVYPPKMASVASSSRFCFLTLVNGAKPLGVKGEPQFECECEIKGLNRPYPPTLDAYFKDSNTYFEVKCHEIFTSHNIKMSEEYRKYVSYPTGDFNISEADINPSKKGNNKEFTIYPHIFGLNDDGNSKFDIKQLICHLLGIKSKSEGKQAKLIYLFFYPVTNDNETNEKIQEVFAELKNEIGLIFNSKPIRTFCEKNNITLEAYAERNTIMTDLHEDNVIRLFP